jgi:trimethylamine-N-oxide reductase (cytochrome c)
MVFADAILNGHTEQWGTTAIGAQTEDQFIKYTYPISEEEGGTRVHLVWQDHACHSGCWNDTNSYIHAIRDSSIECNIVQHHWFESDCAFADIILPVNTSVEQRDIMSDGREQRVLNVRSRPPIDPVGESKADDEIFVAVAEKLEKYGGRYEGLANKITMGKTVEEWIQYAYSMSGAEDYLSWDEFQEKGYVLAPLSSGWEQEDRGLINFYNDPDNNPLSTPSGKLEFYSERLAENFPGDEERGPYPKYVCGGPASTHDESIVIEDGAERCKTYPLLMQASHVRWRVHSQNDDIPWLREIQTCKVKGYDGYNYEPVWIHPNDAEPRGIKHGDIVKVFNDRGIELAGAYVTERIKPGAVHMDNGSRMDMIACEESDYDDRGNKWIDRGGALNAISPHPGLSQNVAGMSVSGYLVEVKKVTGDEMQEWRDKYPEAFSRAYDPYYGLLLDAWVEKEV